MDRLLHFFWFGYQRRELDALVYEDSNSEIQKWAERSLEEHFAVHSTSCVTEGRVTTSAGDVLIGHPTWDSMHGQRNRRGRLERDWVRDNRLSDGAVAHPNTYILMPWVPTFPVEWTDYMPRYESQLDAARLVFGICGRIWHERTLALDGSTVQGRVKSKLVRLDMCVNSDALEGSKSAFNPPGRRKLLHVSNLGSYKGFDLLLESTRGVAVPSIGTRMLADVQRGEVTLKFPHQRYRINHLGKIDNGDAEGMDALVEAHDFYLQTSTMDAQATTILEYAARGLVPIVTPESGFESEDAIYLTRDAARNREIIDSALQMREEELRYRSERIKAQIRSRHSWRTFYDTIASHIRRTCVD